MPSNCSRGCAALPLGAPLSEGVYTCKITKQRGNRIKGARHMGGCMKFALFNQLQRPKPWRENEEVLVYKEAIEEAVYAEAVGFDAYWQTEHHFYTEIGHSSAPEVVLAAISQRTSRLRLGLGVVVLPCNHPYRVAEYVSTLDVVSGGRVEFGTGRGASPYHVEAFGFSPSETKAVWEESLQVICAMFLNDTFPGWHGKHYDHFPP